jgi:hypothetical protein
MLNYVSKISLDCLYLVYAYGVPYTRERYGPLVETTLRCPHPCRGYRLSQSGYRNRNMADSHGINHSWTKGALRSCSRIGTEYPSHLVSWKSPVTCQYGQSVPVLLWYIRIFLTNSAFHLRLLTRTSMLLSWWFLVLFMAAWFRGLKRVRWTVAGNLTTW